MLRPHNIGNCLVFTTSYMAKDLWFKIWLQKKVSGKRKRIKEADRGDRKWRKKKEMPTWKEPTKKTYHEMWKWSKNYNAAIKGNDYTNTCVLFLNSLLKKRCAVKNKSKLFFPSNQNVWRVFILGALLKLYKPIHTYTRTATLRIHFTFHHPKNGVRCSVERDTFHVYTIFNVLSCRS